jgi:hypothetical protein
MQLHLLLRKMNPSDYARSAISRQARNRPLVPMAGSPPAGAESAPGGGASAVSNHFRHIPAQRARRFTFELFPCGGSSRKVNLLARPPASLVTFSLPSTSGPCGPTTLAPSRTATNPFWSCAYERLCPTFASLSGDSGDFHRLNQLSHSPTFKSRKPGHTPGNVKREIETYG